MHEVSRIFMEDVVEKLRAIKKEDRLEDGSVEVSISDNDIKGILNKKVLRSNVKQRISDDLNAVGINVKVCITNDLKVTIPDAVLDDKTIKYSELKKD